VRGRPLIALVLVACGRLHFGPLATDGGGDAIVIDGVPDRPNVAFVTFQTSSGMLGGLSGADAMCASYAAMAGLQGHFIALLSTTTVNAKDRLAGSRGWIRTDGAPIADLPSDLWINGHMLNPIDHGPDGMRLPYAGLNTWSGTDEDGNFDTINSACGDWMSGTGIGAVGLFDRSAPYAIATAGGQPCANIGHLYCFEVGHAFPVQPIVSTGRFAFVGSSTGSIGIAAMNAQCQSDATAAGLPGTYVAAVATTTTSIASNFTGLTGWVRVDGTPVSADTFTMFDGSDLLSFVNQAADGTYLAGQFTPNTKTGASNATSTGTNASTCNDWTNTNGTGIGGSPIDADPVSFWGGTTASCNLMYAQLCLQQ
jgi:hypothetical protein